jgi:hypothetical protein
VRRIARSILLALALALFPAAASSASPTPVEPIDIGALRPRGPIHDTVLPPSGVRARAAAAFSEQFIDVGDHVVTMTTDIPGLDLLPYAQLLTWVIHYDEIEDVTVEVVAPTRIAEVCGEGAVGCYQPENPGRSPRGWMWIPSVHPDLDHILVHEYGHHMDNQLLNLAHLDMGCDASGDGSRDWFFRRDADDSLLDSGISCSSDNDWSYLLAELYAEDYTWLHGNRYWRPDFPVGPPGDLQLEAMSSDMASPFERRARRYSPKLDHRESRFISVKLDHWTFFTSTLRGRRAANLDLYLRKAHARRALARSRGEGSREKIERMLAPGRYEIEIFAVADSGRGTLRLFLD